MEGASAGTLLLEPNEPRQPVRDDPDPREVAENSEHHRRGSTSLAIFRASESLVQGLEGRAADEGGDGKRQLEAMREALESEGVDLHDPQLSKGDYVEIALSLVLPGGLAVLQVLMPFGTPFARDGDNGILQNWAYYFWYTPFGFGAMWVKVVLWNCELWDRDFFVPFMQSRRGLFRCNPALVPVAFTTVFVVALFLCGYLVFHNPVPIGTISFGVPCYVVLFILMYFFVVPPECRQTLDEHLVILKCWVPFVIWVVLVVVHTVIISFQNNVILKTESTVLLVLGNWGVQAVFLLINWLVGMIPVDAFMGVRHYGMSLLWNLGYDAVCSTMSDWIFPGMPRSLGGILSNGGVILQSFASSMLQLRAAREVEEIIRVFLAGVCGVVSSWAFLLVFAYNSFGPNQAYIYGTCGMSSEKKREAMIMIFIVVLVNAFKLFLMFRYAKTAYEPGVKTVVMSLGLFVLRQWYWLVTWLLVATSAVCGSCMVMMHDGMDFSFSFKQWAGTWPFMAGD